MFVPNIVAGSGHSDAFDLANRLQLLEQSLKPKKAKEEPVVVEEIMEIQDDGLSENIRRYKKEKIKNKSEPLSISTLYLLFFLLMPTIIGSAIVLAYMNQRFYKKYANTRPIDMRYRDFWEY